MVASGFLIVHRGLLRDAPSPSEAFLLCIIGFGLASALITGLLRASEGVLAVTRYGAFVGLAEAALVSFAARALAPYWTSERLRKIVLLVCLCFGVAMLPEQVAVGLKVRAKAQVVAQAAQAIRSGDLSDPALEALHPRPEVVREVLEAFGQRGVRP